MPVPNVLMLLGLSHCGILKNNLLHIQIRMNKFNTFSAGTIWAGNKQFAHVLAMA